MKQATALSDQRELFALTNDEQGGLVVHEEIIKRHWQGFYEVGAALKSIRDMKLYKEADYKDFDTYCLQRWGFKRVYAHYLIKSSEVWENLHVHNCERLPENEAQVRPLTRLEKDQQCGVWMEVIKGAKNGKITARRVQECVSKVITKPEPKPENTEAIKDRIIKRLEQLKAKDPKAFRQIQKWFEKN